jgi:hypothetical protein
MQISKRTEQAVLKVLGAIPVGRPAVTTHDNSSVPLLGARGLHHPEQNPESSQAIGRVPQNVGGTA